jgi:ribosomal protein S18 acetylase RimI-like enzyme
MPSVPSTPPTARACAAGYELCYWGSNVTLHDHTINIREATTADAAALAAFGELTFRDAFAAQNRPEDVEKYVAATYSLALQRAELTDPTRLTLVAEVGDAFAAYAQLRSGDAPACVSATAPIELLRFYVDRSWHGRGLAQQLMAAVVAAAESRRARTLWLGVWEHNPRAIAFYTRSGFRDVGSQGFVLGTDHQTDRIMLRPLG